MNLLRPYIFLARLDKPVGIGLLLLPALWALTLAAPQGVLPDMMLVIYFTLGAVLMRAAGCAVNDVVDHKKDALVERTCMRPVASGMMKPWQALVFAALCTVLSLLIILNMPRLVFWLALSALPLIIIYPFMKRISWWPQAFLGVVFNWGALMGFAAAGQPLCPRAVILHAACFFWTLGYDTIYAFQDVRDDEQAAIKSTARFLGVRAKKWVTVWFGFSFFLLLVVGAMTAMGLSFYLGMGFALMYLIAQVKSWVMDDPRSSLAVFRANISYGLLVLVSLVAGRLWP